MMQYAASLESWEWKIYCHHPVVWHTG